MLFNKFIKFEQKFALLLCDEQNFDTFLWRVL